MVTAPKRITVTKVCPSRPSKREPLGQKQLEAATKGHTLGEGAKAHPLWGLPSRQRQHAEAVINKGAGFYSSDNQQQCHNNSTHACQEQQQSLGLLQALKGKAHLSWESRSVTLVSALSSWRDMRSSSSCRQPRSASH